MPAESEEPELVRWRPWPCENCRGGASLLDYLLGCHEAGGEIPGDSEDEVVEQMVARERARVVDWVESCEHTAEHSDALARLDEGSEHIVFEAANSDQSTGLQDQSGATASIGDLIEQGLVIHKQLDAIMHNKYAGDPAKLAAWLTASNIQWPSTAKAATPVPPTPPPTP